MAITDINILLALTGLTDTPDSLEGQQGKFLIVKADEEGFELIKGVLDNLFSKDLVLTENRAHDLGNNNFCFKNGRLGLGIENPITLLHLVGNGGSTFFVDGYTDGLAPLFSFRRARGSEMSPTALLENDAIGSIGGRGHNGSTIPNNTRVSVILRAAENWEVTKNGTRLEFLTTENGTTTTSEKMRIDHNGNVGIGTTTPTEKLEVNGNIKASRFLGASDYIKMPFKLNVNISHTGTTTNTIIASFLIKAGTFEANDILRYRAAINTTNNANSKQIRCYFNSTISLSGATQISVRNATSAQGGSFSRDLVFANSLSSQKILNPTTSIADDEAASTLINTTSVDFTIDQYFIVAVELADASDNVTLNFLRSEIFR